MRALLNSSVDSGLIQPVHQSVVLGRVQTYTSVCVNEA